MISVLFSLLFGLLGYFFSKTIRNHFNIILVLTVVFSGVSFFIDLEVATEGFIGLALFIVVMYAGAFKKGSKFNKRFKSIRKEYSILGFVVLLPHAITYLLQFLDGSYPVEWFGVIAYAIMIPLFIISFSFIKKKMDIRKWFSIQRWAYLAYATIFIHLLLIGQTDHLIAYTVIFSVYTFLKLKNYAFKENTSIAKTVKSIGVTVLVVLVSLTFTGTIEVSALIGSFEATTVDVSLLEDGVYNGEATGFKNLDVSLEVTVEDGMIIDINIIEYGATSSHGGVNFKNAGEEMAENIISTQDTGIDSISGATKTTEGIQDAVVNALS